MAEQPDAHAPEDVAGPHGHDDEDHAGIALGPIDVQAWAAAAGGVVLGLLVVYALIQSLS